MKKMMFVAALCAVAGAAVAAGLGPQNYVQDGLVTHFDAIDNEGTGTHNPSATTWRDLKGSAYITLQTGASWTDRYFDSTANQHIIKTMPVYSRTSLTMEVPVNVISNGISSSGSYPRIFANGENFSIYFERTGSTACLYFNGQNPDTRPNCGSFRIGTVFVFGSSERYGIGLNGLVKSQTSVPVKVSVTKPAADWVLNGNSGYLHGHYYGLRFYNRYLTSDELKTNAAVDGLRFWSYTYTGTGVAENWSDIAWLAPEKVTGAAPSTLTNDFAQIANAAVNVAASDHVGLAGLSLEDGATLNLAADAIAAVKVLYVEGVAVPRGVYTGTGPVGTQVSWLSGDGILGVAGSLDRGAPSLVPTPAADGWYEFGLASGWAHGRTTGYSGSPSSTLIYITGTRPMWEEYAFPAGAKLRLVGGILLETVPAGVFSEYDMSGLKIVYLHGSTAFADGTPLTIPSGCAFRYQSGTWKPDAVIANRWWLTAKGADEITYTGDIVNNGTMHISYDGEHAARNIYTGDISGNGKFYIYNFGNQCRFQGRFDMIDATQQDNLQNGNLIWIDTLYVGGNFKGLTFGGGGTYGMNTSWSANGLLFGKNDSDVTADNELKIGTLNGNASSGTDANGKRWRSGGHIIVWGNNTVHVGELKSSLHVVARREDQHCNQGWLGSAKSKGIGNIVIDKLTSGEIYGSTNINVKVGTVVVGSTFDYTYQSNAVNRMTLDITNSCNASAIVKATDIGMLPARLSGFTGTVTLTDTATVRSYTMPVDVTHGTNYLYNTTGCIGSGTLGSAPASGTIDVTFPTTGDKPVKGKYALARFTSGGELLANWTVTQNGQAVEATVVNGMEIRTKKDATGLWLDVREPGVRFIIR
ncbi:MAG: hypothetical protein IJL17_05615 [Kiritimatiellae bacterium]|nr:hypothetical protein [Kiritimatiellia bacterium]